MSRPDVSHLVGRGRLLRRDRRVCSRRSRPRTTGGRSPRSPTPLASPRARRARDRCFPRAAISSPGRRRRWRGRTSRSPAAATRRTSRSSSAPFWEPLRAGTDRIHFAGEHLEALAGYMESAVRSGIRILPDSGGHPPGRRAVSPRFGGPLLRPFEIVGVDGDVVVINEVDRLVSAVQRDPLVVELTRNDRPVRDCIVSGYGVEMMSCTRTGPRTASTCTVPTLGGDPQTQHVTSGRTPSSSVSVIPYSNSDSRVPRRRSRRRRSSRGPSAALRMPFWNHVMIEKVGTCGQKLPPELGFSRSTNPRRSD